MFDLDASSTLRLKFWLMMSCKFPNCSLNACAVSLSTCTGPTATTFALRTASSAVGSRHDSPKTSPVFIRRMSPLSSP